MRRIGFVIAVLLALAVPGAAFAGSGDPTPSRAAGGAAALSWGTTPADAAAMAAQTQPLAAADALRNALSGLPGYANVGLDGQTVQLLWKGALPAKATKLVAQLSTTTTITVTHTTYSHAELQAAADTLRAQIEAGRGNGVQSISIPFDSSGLVLGVDASTADAATAGASLSARSVSPSAAQLTAVKKTLSAAATKVATSVAVEPRITQFSRENDFPPWAGGAVMQDRTTTSMYYYRSCTTGIPMVDQSNRVYLLTASHCADFGDLVKDPAGQTMGNVKFRDHDHNVELIQVTSAAGQIYVGGPQGSKTQAIKNIMGWSVPYFGESICTSGAFKGNNCGLTIKATDDIKCDIEPNDKWKCWGPLQRAVAATGVVAGVPGDSGGPVYYNPVGYTKIMMLGTITGGDNANTLWFVSLYEPILDEGIWQESLNVITN